MTMKNKIGTALLAAALTLAVHTAAPADEAPSGTFLTDYTLLGPAPEDPGVTWKYVAPGAPERLAGYNAVMIDLPVVSIAADSKRTWMNPYDMVALSEGLRAAVAREVTKRYYVVDRPGPNVLHMRFAVHDLYLKTKPKKAYQYVPVAAAVSGVRSIATTNLARKMSLEGVSVEVEILDSQTGDVMTEIVDNRRAGKVDPTSWEELEELLAEYGIRASCRLDNMRLPENERVNCFDRG